MSSPTLNALVHTMRYEADGIVSVEFRPATPAVDFPAFEAGSHIDLHLPNGLVRSYSLCNPASDRQRYVVGVLNDRKSRGGSRYVHQQLRVGMTLPISVPRNNFKLQEGADRSVLVAGGIGVTPIWCMLQRLVAIGKPVELLYCARTRKEAAFCDAIEALAKEKSVQLTWHFDDEKGAPPGLAALLAGKGATSHYYCCGPTPMLDAFERSCEQLGYANAHIERFAAVHVEAPSAMQSYVVQCAKSGKSVEVPAGKSILDSLIDAGLNPDHSCKEGVCGACETAVLEGEVDAAVTYTRGSGTGAGSTVQLSNSGNMFSRLGFRGTEDLGGGLSANFWLEMGLQNDTGTGFPSNANNQASGAGPTGSLSFNRRSTVSLAGPFGEVRLGRDYVPTFWNTAIFDPFGTGSGIGANQIYFSGLGGLVSPVGTRASDSIGYLLPASLGGFYGQVMYAMGENNSTSVVPGTLVSNERDGNHTGLRLGYANGDLNIAIATGRTRYASGDLRVTNLGAAYTFGPSLSNLKLTSELYTESKGALVGFQLPIGPGEIKASYARYRLEPAAAALKPTSSKLAIGYVHNLSKRTALYATVARISNRNGAAQALAGAITMPNRASTGTEFGMRHMF